MMVVNLVMPVMPSKQMGNYSLPWLREGDASVAAGACF